MAAIGKYNKLRVVELVEFGAYLDGGEQGKILMPKRYTITGCEIGDEVEVFVYLDSEDRLVATTEQPLATVDEFAFLRVVEATKVGAFLDWGLAKDLLVPFREQKLPMEKDRWYVVRVYIDHETNRIVGSAKVDRFLDNVPPDYAPGQEVSIIVYAQTPLGYSVIVNNLHWGVVYSNEIFSPIRVGLITKGYIKKVRSDDKIDISLQRTSYRKLDELAQQLLHQINSSSGFLPLTDRSSPEEVTKRLGMSKKNFKKAVGTLYRMRLITIDEDGVRVTADGAKQQDLREV